MKWNAFDWQALLFFLTRFYLPISYSFNWIKTKSRTIRLLIASWLPNANNDANLVYKNNDIKIVTFHARELHFCFVLFREKTKFLFLFVVNLKFHSFTYMRRGRVFACNNRFKESDLNVPWSKITNLLSFAFFS